jgi:hypothetical protein
MSASQIITMLGVTILVIYIITQILNFYGIGQDVYGIYLSFFIFLVITSFILPTKNPTI